MNARRLATRWILASKAAVVAVSSRNVDNGKGFPEVAYITLNLDKGRCEDRCVRDGKGKRLGSKEIVKMCMNNSCIANAYSAVVGSRVVKGAVESGMSRDKEGDDFASIGLMGALK